MEEELRKKAILRHVVGGEKPRTIYTELHRSKQWFFKWLKRYHAGDTDWYKDISRAPMMRSRETPYGKQELILAIRKRLESERHAQVGVSAIKWELQKLGVHFPSDRTITRIIAREGLVKKNFVRAQGCGVSLFSGGAVLQ
ncbi:MAG: hypothetical protein JRC86_09920 [Deltaproteobacteria bacterium]|nr:hypothetical protein [Deltaproteobacteria bacterium]